MTKYKKIAYAILSFILCLFALVVGVFPTTNLAHADAVQTDSALEIEKTNVYDDLKNTTINGKPFSLETYNFDESKDTQVLSFIEYCYSFKNSKRDYFGLYVIVYNPRGIDFQTESPLNKLQLSYGEQMSYTKYALTYINKSTGSIDGLFYKFKVNISEPQRDSMLNGLNSINRVYRVSGVELITKGEYTATEYAVATTYSYSGFAKGCGRDESAESTLTWTSKQADETLSLTVTPTFYRPDGTNGKNAYTQDSLHSVYFAVPNNVIKRYGAMTAIHATWLNAVLAPMLVTGNAEAYKNISNYLGANVSDVIIDGDGVGGGGFGVRGEDLEYAYLGACSAAGGAVAGNIIWNYGYGYNVPTGAYYIQNGYGKDVNALYFMFHSGSGENSADNYTVSSEEMLKALETSGSFSGRLINGKYSERVFERVDSKFTEVNIKADENFSLTSELVSDSWWERLWGIGSTSKTFDGIKAIYAVTENDIKGTDEEISARLYVDVGDVAQLKTDFAAARSAGKTLYLFRYQVSDYIAQEATLFHKVSILWFETWEKKDSNAYFFQQTVNLDFDIIDVTFSNGITETVMPVVSNPIDVTPGTTPPIYTTPDIVPDVSSCVTFAKDMPWWVWLIVAVVALVLIGKFVPAICQGLKIVFLVVTAPIWLPVWLLVKLIQKIRGE